MGFIPKYKPIFMKLGQYVKNNISNQNIKKKFLGNYLKYFNWKKIKKNSKKYRKVAYVGHIGNMVRNDFDHEKKYQDLFFIKENLSELLINYRSLRIK